MKSGSVFHEHNYKDREETLLRSVNNNIEPKISLFGGEKQPLFIKK